MRTRHETSPIVAALLGLALIALTTLLMHGINAGLSKIEGHPVRPFEIGYLVPVALITLLWGRGGGMLALAASGFAAIYFLIPGPGFHINKVSDLAGLGFMGVTGLFMIAAVDTARRNHYLRIEALARARRSSLVGQLARLARSSMNPAEIQTQALAMVAQLLNVDRAYLLAFRDVDETAAVSTEWHRPQLAPLASGDFAPTFANCLVASMNTSAQVRSDHHPLLAGVPSSDLEGLGLTSVIHVPITAGEHISGIFGVAMTGGQRIWTEDEISLVEIVSAEMRAVVDSARLTLRERNIANALQAALLPQPNKEIDGLDIATFYKAALAEASIGGDFCDIFNVRGTQWAFIVGDVSGKGLRAASQIATVRNMLRAVIYLDDCVSCAISRLNGMLVDHGLLNGFVTLFAAIYDTCDRSFEYVNCGHEPPLLRRADGEIIELKCTGPVLGVIEGAPFFAETQPFAMNDALLVYTDGASEAGPTRSAQLGSDGLADLLGRQSVGATSEQITTKLAESIQAFAEGKTHDDICLLVVQSLPTPNNTAE